MPPQNTTGANIEAPDAAETIRREQVRTELQQAIVSTHEWKLSKKGGVLHLQPESLAFSMLDHNWYRLDDFALVDTRLPSVIRTIIELNNKDRLPAGPATSMFNFYLQEALLFWKNEHLVLPREALMPATNHLEHVNKIIDVEFETEKRQLSIEYYAYNIVTTDDGVVFSCEDKHNWRKLQSNWLDTHYPGWDRQMLAAHSLDACLIEALTRLLDGPPSAPSVHPPSDLGNML